MAGNATTADPTGLVNVLISVLPIFLTMFVVATAMRALGFFRGRGMFGPIAFSMSAGMIVLSFFGLVPAWVAASAVVVTFGFYVFNVLINQPSSSLPGPHIQTDEELLQAKLDVAVLTEAALRQKLEEANQQLALLSETEATMTQELADAEDEIYELEEQVREATKTPETKEEPYHCPTCGTTDPRPHECDMAMVKKQALNVLFPAPEGGEPSDEPYEGDEPDDGDDDGT